MKKNLIILALVSGILSSTQVYAAVTEKNSIVIPGTQVVSGKQIPLGMTQEQFERMEYRRNLYTYNLNLAPEQIVKIRAIQAQAKADAEKIQQDAAKKILAVYTPEQRALVEKIKKEREEQKAVEAGANAKKTTESNVLLINHVASAECDCPAETKCTCDKKSACQNNCPKCYAESDEK